MVTPASGPPAPPSTLPPSTGIVVDNGDGGFTCAIASLADAIGSDTYYPHAREHLFLALVSVSPDGLFDIRKATTETTYEHGTKLPDKTLLKRCAGTFIETGRPPNRIGHTPLHWKVVPDPREIVALIKLGILSAPAERMLAPDDFLAAFASSFKAIRETRGSLAELVGRHHRNVPGLLAMFSTVRSRHAETVRSRPWLDESWLDHLPEGGEPSGSVTPDLVAEILNTYFAPKSPISPAAIRWCDRFFATHAEEAPRLAFLSLLTALPRSWWPADRDDYLALNTTANHLLSLCDNDAGSALDMLRPSKGRFARYIAEIGQSLLPPETGTAQGAVVWNGVHNFAQPHFDRVALALADCVDFLLHIDAELVMPFTMPHTGGGSLGAARRVVSEGGGMRRFIEASQRWHRIPRMQGLLTTPEHVWPACVDRFVHEGIEVVELCGAIDLWNEGVAMDHCVGGDNYVRSCMAGTSRIVALRAEGKGLSTAEFMFRAGEAVIYQHRGQRNLTPPARADAALHAWMSAIGSGTLKTYPITSVPVPDATVVTLPGDGPAAWRPFIRRDLASMSWEKFGEQVMELCSPVPEAEDDPSPL